MPWKAQCDFFFFNLFFLLEVLEGWNEDARRLDHLNPLPPCKINVSTCLQAHNLISVILQISNVNSPIPWPRLRGQQRTHLDAEGLMDICGQLSFPPLQLPLHLSHPGRGDSTEQGLPAETRAPKVRAHPTQARRSELNSMSVFACGLSFFCPPPLINWELTSINPSGESFNGHRLKNAI